MTDTPNETPKAGAVAKIFLGVLLPLVLFVVFSGIVFQSACTSPDAGIGALRLWIIYIPGIPAILMVNSMLMIRRWPNAGVACSVGLILPACLVVAELLLLALWR
jgi:hypothetical protein